MAEDTKKPQWWRTEDWLAVWVGGLLLAAVLAGWRPAPPALKWEPTATSVAKLWSNTNLVSIAVVGATCLITTLGALALQGARVLRVLAGFPVVFLLALAAQALAGCSRVEAWGIEYVLFGLLLGLTISHTVGLPDWLREAVRTEFYIKTGLIILGSTILFQEIMKAGLLGVAQALLVVTVVWYFAFWLARKLGVDDEFSTMLSTAVSICGVSAAIAACGAINGDRRKLSYVTSLVLIVAVPMMVLMPWVVKTCHIPDLVGGAWLGGTLDTSGSVVAAGALISERAMKTGVIVKFSQNVLIGVAAFFISVWWAVRSQEKTGEKVGVSVIWERFPKFVLGFVGASLLFSFVVDPKLAGAVKGTLNGLRNTWFALAFVSIGLETRFADLWGMGNGRPAAAFIGAQTFNVFWTFVVAWLFFGGLIFAIPDIR